MRPRICEDVGVCIFLCHLTPEARIVNRYLTDVVLLQFSLVFFFFPQPGFADSCLSELTKHQLGRIDGCYNNAGRWS